MSASAAAGEGLSAASRRPRKFAPLDPEKSNVDDAPRLKGIIFDVDGTLCLPQNYMFKEMRAALNIPKSTDILDHIRTLSDTPDHSTNKSPRAAAKQAIEDIESRAMSVQRPQPGLVELMDYLQKRKLPKALCTRNFPLPVSHLLTTFLPKHVFSPIITRETPDIPPKPSPAGLWKIAEAWAGAPGPNPPKSEATGIEGTPASNPAPSSGAVGPGTPDLKSSVTPSDDPLDVAREHLGSGLIMVGDSIDDMAAGTRAGAATVLLLNEENGPVLESGLVDLAVKRLDDLIDKLEGGFVGSDA